MERGLVSGDTSLVRGAIGASVARGAAAASSARRVTIRFVRHARNAPAK